MHTIIEKNQQKAIAYHNVKVAKIYKERIGYILLGCAGGMLAALDLLEIGNRSLKIPILSSLSDVERLIHFLALSFISFISLLSLGSVLAYPFARYAVRSKTDTYQKLCTDAKILLIYVCSGSVIYIVYMLGFRDDYIPLSGSYLLVISPFIIWLTLHRLQVTRSIKEDIELVSQLEIDKEQARAKEAEEKRLSDLQDPFKRNELILGEDRLRPR